MPSYNYPIKHDPLTDEIIDYTNTHSLVRFRRETLNKVFVAIHIIVVIFFVVFLIFYLGANANVKTDFLICTIVFVVLTVADVVWYVIHIVKSNPALKKENEAISNWTKERIKRAMEEEMAQEEASSSIDSLEEKKED